MIKFRRADGQDNAMKNPPIKHSASGIPYVRIDELPEIEQIIARTEMRGSGCPVIDEEQGAWCIFDHDYDRILRHIERKTALYCRAEKEILERGLENRSPKELDGIGL